jgi:hypothetical protein
VLTLSTFFFWQADAAGNAEQARSLFAVTAGFAILGGILSTWIGLALSALRLRR